MRSGSADISSEDVDSSEMTSNSGIYTISKRELEGHDNLGHSISQVTIADEKLETAVIEVSPTMPLKPKVRLGPKLGISIDIIIAIFAFIWIFVTEFGFVPNYKQGFFCGTDDKIIYKYNGDSITMAWVCVTVTFPIIIMYFVEVCRCDREMSKAIKSKKTLYQVFLWSREYIVGLTVKLFIVETLKVVIGELRPHFLDTCKPDAAINCTKGDYITDYTCTNKRDSFYLISDSSKSFPSGHASIGFYEGLFLAWYLHRRFPTSSSNLFRPLLQCICLTWGLVCGATRVVDNRHFWWDVVTGDLIGATFAIVVCAVMCKNFKTKSVPEHTNQNGHASVRRLLSNNSCKDETNIAMAQA